MSFVGQFIPPKLDRLYEQDRAELKIYLNIYLVVSHYTCPNPCHFLEIHSAVVDVLYI